MTTTVKQFLTTSEQVCGALSVALKQGYLHIQEVAEVVGCSERQAYRYVEGEVPLKANQYITLALIEHSRGGNNLLELIIPNNKILCDAQQTASNGRVEDEAIEIIQALGKATDDYSKANFDSAMKDADSLVDAGKKIKLEAQQAKKRSRK